MANQTPKRRRKVPFWSTKEAKRALWVFGIPLAILLLWYFYTVIFELNKPTMTRVEANVKAGIAALAERARREGFRTADVNKCEDMVAEYTTPKGWYYSKETLYQLVGLDRDATQAQMNERCVFFAKAVAEMEKMSHHLRHVFVCGDSILDVGDKGKYYLKPAPDEQGALQNFENSLPSLIKIPVGGMSVMREYQIYNAGAGCLIVGLSKKSTFRMSAEVLHSK